MSKSDRSFGVVSGCVLAVLGILSGAPQQTQASTQSKTDGQLESAISVLRHIDSQGMSENQKEEKGKEINKAWEVVRAAGKNGIQRLKQEIQKIASANERDDFFKLNAASLLWQIGQFGEVESIAGIWNSTPLQAQYNYVFYTAFSAAVTQDPRVLPMLEACLRDDKGKLFIALHSLDIGWPLSHEFLWGAYGPKGLPILAHILETSSNSVELQSAMILLANDQFLPALPAIRKLSTNSNADVRRTAIRSLGEFGHPQDYESLISGLKSNDSQELFHVVYALYEYEDLRAVPLLIPLINTDNEALRGEVLATLLHLTSVASIDAIQKHCAQAKSESEKTECSSPRLVGALEEAGISLLTFSKTSQKEKDDLVARFRSKQKEEFEMNPSDRKPTSNELSAVLSEWRENHRPNSDRYSWIESRHIIAAAGEKTVDALLDAKASFYTRLSDECLYDVHDIRAIIRWVGRGRYRKTPGLTERVEAR